MIPRDMPSEDGYIAEKVKEMDEMKKMMDHVKHEQIKSDAELIMEHGGEYHFLAEKLLKQLPDEHDSSGEQGM